MRRTRLPGAVLVATAALAMLPAGCSRAPAAGEPAATAAPASPTGPDPRLEGSYRFEHNGWIYVHLEGAPGRLGYQHGYLLAPEIDDLLRVVEPLLLHNTKRDWQFYREASERMLWPKIEPEYQQELDGIVEGLRARGSAADRWDIVALNALEELPDYYVPWLDRQEKKTPATHAPGNCSAFIAAGDWTTDGGIVIGHNTWTNYATGSRWNVVFDLKPERGYAILMDGLPGVIASDDDFGVNANGIVITETTITGFEGWDPEGTPEFFRARKAMQYSASIDDYVRIMTTGNNGGYANDWLVGDNKTGEIARLELGLKKWTVERTKNGYYVGANFPVGAELIRTETTFDPRKKDSSPNARRARWEQLMAQYKGKIDARVGQAFEADAYDVIEQRNGPTERSLCGTNDVSPRGIPEWDWPPYFPGGTVQAKVMDRTMAQGLRLWAAMGHPCASDFKAEVFLDRHPEFGWMRPMLRDMPTGPWTEFRTGMTRPASQP